MRAALHYFKDFGLEKRASIYMTEQITRSFRWMKARYPNVQGSEYLVGKELGSVHDGVRCEDLQQLTFSSGTFDAVISLDVLEHIPDHCAGLREIRRVLKPGGLLILTCPFIMQLEPTRRQARIDSRGEIEHLIPVPEYHGNPLGPPSLSFNTFGWSLLADMRQAGFSDAHIVPYRNAGLGYVGGPFPLMIGQA
jgi:SAM-dependent methyltransferase